MYMLKRRDHANEPVVNQHSGNHLESFNRLPIHFSIAKQTAVHHLTTLQLLPPLLLVCYLVD
jgi:hypothetical protein